MNTPTRPMRGRTRSQVWTLSVRGQFTSADSAHHAMPPVRHRLLHWRRHQLRRRRQRITPVGSAIEECRMQFPRPCITPRIRIVGIATCVDTVEHSPNRIACETAPSERTRAHVGPPVSPLPGNRTQEAHPRACGPTISHVNRLIRAWASSFARWPTNTSVGTPAQTRNSGLTCDIAG